MSAANTRKRPWIYVGLGLALVVLLVVPASLPSPGVYRAWHVCRVCGLERATVDYRIPATRVTLSSRATDRVTAYAQAYAEAGGDDHVHDLAFMSGHGNGITCALGRDRDLQRSADDPDRGALLRGLFAREASPDLRRIYAEQVLAQEQPPVLPDDRDALARGPRPDVICHLDARIAAEVFQATLDEQHLALERGLAALLAARSEAR
ncbi:MAG: hypothetical protein R3F62_13685 [Planctomycetota bacterium]